LFLSLVHSNHLKDDQARLSTEASSTQMPGLIVEEMEMLLTYFPLLLGGLARRTASISALAFS
jgi:hypothetical protein